MNQATDDDGGGLLACDQLRAALGTAIIGRELRHLPSTGSTNDDLRLLAQGGAREGLVLSTDQQVKGRGRRGRVWHAPPATSILVSTLLRPSWLRAADAFYLTMLAGVAAAEAAEEIAAPITIELKWPNDLQVAGLKLGGILVETELSGGRINWAIVGIGVNCNWNPASVPELAGIATSLADAAGRPISRTDLFTALLRRLDTWYTRLNIGARTALWEAWRSRLAMLGRPVRAEVAGKVLEGIAEDVTDSGALIVRDAEGRRHELAAGEITIRNR